MIVESLEGYSALLVDYGMRWLFVCLVEWVHFTKMLPGVLLDS